MKFYSYLKFSVSCNLVFALAGIANGATLTVTPSMDATIFGGSGETSGANGSRGTFYVGANAALSVRRTLLAFNLTSIPSGSTVTNVTLQLTCTQVPGATAQTLSLRKLTANWSEGPSTGGGIGGGQPTIPAVANDVTWIQRIVPSSNWGTAGGDFIATVSGSQTVNGTGVFVWGSTAQMVADVQAWVTTPANNFGWIMQGNESSPQSAKEFASREDTTAANRPTLTITYNLPAGVEEWSLY